MMSTAVAFSRRSRCIVKPSSSMRCVSLHVPSSHAPTSMPLANISCWLLHDENRTTRKRYFSSGSSWDAEYEGLVAQRNKHIIMHPEGHGQHILPGNYVIKKNEKTGAEKKVFLEHALGYFWAIKVSDVMCVLYLYYCS